VADWAEGQKGKRKQKLTVVPNDQISVAVPHLKFNIASGLRKIAAPIICPSSFLDEVLSSRLARIFREQGWPNYLIRRVQSFAMNKAVQIRLDEETGPQTSITCDLPQSSSISSILFMLYIAFYILIKTFNT